MYHLLLLGTKSFNTSLLNYISVGVTSSAIITGLSLQSGSTYYAILQAVDYAGRMSYIVSRGITIDVTPPIIGGVRLVHITQFQSELSVEWNVIHDGESGISSLEWSLGTRPSSSDIAGWNEFVWGQDTRVTFNTQYLSLYEGQLLFASLKVSSILATW